MTSHQNSPLAQASEKGENFSDIEAREVGGMDCSPVSGRVRDPLADVYSMFDLLSDAIFVVNAKGTCIYRNPNMDEFPAHLEQRAILHCQDLGCACDIETSGQQMDMGSLEGWQIHCSPLGDHKAIICKYDVSFGERIMRLREDFASEQAQGTPPRLAAMHVLRHHIDARWIAIGHMDWPNERILFDVSYDGDQLGENMLPPFYRNVNFNMCAAPAITSDLSECFARTEPHKALGFEFLVGLALKNHHGKCVGYAMVAFDCTPGDVKGTLTLLQELAVLYGPYFEAGNAREQMDAAIVEANTDIVTGVGNRRAFEAFLQQCLNDYVDELASDNVLAMFDPRALRNSVLMLIDFDAFKRINDTMGHSEGDRALRMVAEKLGHMGGEDCPVFRLGGDEMVQILPRCGELDAEDLRQRINGIEQEMQAEGFPMLGLSMGVVHFFEAEASISSLMTLADARMYQDKKMRSVMFA